jgi:predicted methyltransferase
MRYGKTIGGAILIGLAAVATGPAAAAPSAPIVAAVADKTRPADDLKLDASRLPADLLAFSKARVGDTVIDVWPGKGYWTRLFSTVVGTKGKVYAYVPTEIVGFKSDPMGFAKAVAAEPGRGNVEAVSDPLANQPPPEFTKVADVIWTFENYHDLHNSFMKGADVAGFNRAVFALLKPGGYYVLVDHAAAAGSGLSHTEDLHRIDPAALRAEIEKAGFLFDGETKLLANPSDPRTAGVFDPAIRGKTDRFAYRFRKPLK